ncbi:MAG TPA: TadE/TadG family type IV pilus assembly protein [Longimicrobiales bacterium]
MKRRGIEDNRKAGRRRERGQALVEFALILPLLLLLVIGLVEFGRAWNAFQVITDAAREGARTAVVADASITEDSVYSVIRSALARAALDADSATIALVGVDAPTGQPARVEIQYPYRFTFLSPLMSWIGDRETITLHTVSVMRNE